ncbi:hypothetical protein [Haloplanus pelagicus]|jgi:hypothetical protein|uniref:hypothetical protein n=1 Tax=Haloplanus pelagicus TaxID=2949995 RepID=UPI00203EB0EF|nr:hypothetical protein [Haloplanus sp. HW8-1]
MDRRRVLCLLGLALAPGCTSMAATGPRGPPDPGEPTAAPTDGASMTVSDLRIEEAAGSHLRVLATVTNPSGVERTRTLRIRVTVGDDAAERSREVTVPGGEQRSVAFDFEDVAYAEFSGNGSVQSSLV